ncbi:MAG TPA: YihY/virulence factor BrkB family protein [Microlunatus sp.]
MVATDRPTGSTNKDSKQDSPNGNRNTGGVPGGDAERPTDIPAQGWFQILKRGMAEAKADQVPLLAAGVAFFGFLAIFPALIALVSLYGFFADPAQIANQVNSLAGALPDDVRTLLTQQITTLTSQKSTLGIGAIVAILVALFSASGGMQNLMTAVNFAYDEEEKRSAIKKRLIALALTFAAIVFMIIVLGIVAILPPLLERLLGGGGFAYWLLLIGRFVLLALLVAVALAVLYRVAPDRDAPKIRWVQIGAVMATVLWLVASVGFSLYVNVLGNYAKTYGALAGIVVLLFWLWITAYAVLLGAEINAETEQQTVKDTTKGPEQPIGQRDAVKADSTPEQEAETSRSK